MIPNSSNPVLFNATFSYIVADRFWKKIEMHWPKNHSIPCSRLEIGRAWNKYLPDDTSLIHMLPHMLLNGNQRCTGACCHHLQFRL